MCIQYEYARISDALSKVNSSVSERVNWNKFFKCLYFLLKWLFGQRIKRLRGLMYFDVNGK